MEYNINIPISPEKLSSNQIHKETPPVDDKDYFPSNSKELSNAISTLSLEVPEHLVEKFYMEFKNIMKRYKNDKRSSQIPEYESSPEISNPIVVSENSLRNLIRQRLLESFDPDDSMLSQEDMESLRVSMGEPEYEEFWGDELDKLGYGLGGDRRDRIESGQAAQDPTSYYAASLDDIADEMGFSRASGAKGLQDRAMAKFKLMWENKEQFAKMREYSVESYINLMEMFEVLDEDEAEMFRGNKNAMAANASWRIFHNLAFVEPIMRKLKKNPELVSDLVNVSADYYNMLPVVKKEEILDKALAAAVK